MIALFLVQCLCFTHSAEKGTYKCLSLLLLHTNPKFPISFHSLLVHSNARSHSTTRGGDFWWWENVSQTLWTCMPFLSTSIFSSQGWIPSYFSICERAKKMSNATKETVECGFSNHKVLRWPTQLKPTSQKSTIALYLAQGVNIPFLPEALPAKVQASTTVFFHTIFQLLYHVICTGDRW